VFERRLSILVARRQRHPALNAVNTPLTRAPPAECARNARSVSGLHPIHITGADFLHRAQAVAVLQGPGEEISHCQRAQYAGRPHVDSNIRVRLASAPDDRKK